MFVRLCMCSLISPAVRNQDVCSFVYAFTHFCCSSWSRRLFVSVGVHSFLLQFLLKMFAVIIIYSALPCQLATQLTGRGKTVSYLWIERGHTERKG